MDINNYIDEPEGTKYKACRFNLNGSNILGRTAKITPNKIGQFVTAWKRNSAGITEPYHETDPIDFYIINVNNEDRVGQFIFPRSIMIEKGIMSSKTRDGKRGFRVYPEWDIPINKQALRSQKWQLEYFLEYDKNPDLELMKKLFADFNKKGDF